MKGTNRIIRASICALLVASCGKGNDAEDQGGGGPIPDGGDETSLNFGDAGDGKEPCRRCSADLHHVLDCDGNVIETCAPTDGCAGGTCAPACQAAEASKSSIGCEYYVMVPATGASNACLAAFVTNTWTTPVTVTVDRDGTTFETDKIAYIPTGSGRSIKYEPLVGELPPGEVAIVFLGGNEKEISAWGCPNGLQSAIPSLATNLTTGISTAFRIRTTAPVVANDILPYGNGNTALTSATLLLPTSVWGTNYIGITAYHGFKPWIGIVAKEDGTDVTLSPTVDIVGGGGVEPSPKGVPRTFTLNRGQVLTLQQPEDLVGTPIESTKPIGVWGGADLMQVVDGPADADHKQLAPVSALGHEYVGVRYRDRYEDKPEEPPFRVVGAVDGTVLTYEPAPPLGAPTTIDSGQMVEFRAGAPFVVRSQDSEHPFYMISYMTGCFAYGAHPDCRGDPEFLPMVPPQQFLKTYTFFTDPTYPETNLVVVRKAGGAPVTLDCAGELGGWEPVGAYEYTRVDLVRHDFEPQGACNNGTHRMWSDEPFGLTIWAWGSGATGGEVSAGFYTQTVSYAYPGGASVLPITNVVVKPVPK